MAAIRPISRERSDAPSRVSGSEPDVPLPFEASPGTHVCASAPFDG